MTAFKRIVFGCVLAAALAMTACAAPRAAPTAAPAEEKAPAATANELGVALPPDAAPWEQQVDVTYGEFGPWEHWAEGIYGLGIGSAVNYYTQEGLVGLDSNNVLVPIQAESWEANADATVWTFHLRKGLQWSDGTPLTAQDWVYTFQYQADPENGFDFNWYYDPIKGLSDAVEKKIKPTEIGVSAKDDLTLVFEMKASTPYWPALVASAFPLPKQAIEKCGKRVWSIKPECAVSSGPYVLTKYERDRIAVVSLNKNYKGIARPVIRQYVHKYAPYKDVQWWPLWEKDEIVQVGLETAPVSLQESIKNDPQYKDQLYFARSQGTQYIIMDPTRKPFDDARVRKAFAMAIDREAICRDVLKGTCLPDYGLLPVGFIGEQNDALKPLQAYNPEEAKKLMAEAGYPDGQGFPEMTYYVRSDNPVAPEAIAAMWQETLGVKVNIQTFERTTFMQKMLARNFQLYQLAYYADYPDPANFLTLFLCATKRHEWCSAPFDEIMAKTATETDAAARMQLLHDAERLLIDDVGVVPLNTNLGYTLIKPWVTSKAHTAWRQGAPNGLGSYTYFLLADKYYTKDAPAAWPPVDPQDLK
jgi:ABC-type oligopeptide transport system substrate-binding subunit